ncbi:hypothetical protein PQR71_39945 [Paraburkholderia fungorum]
MGAALVVAAEAALAGYREEADLVVVVELLEGTPVVVAAAA